MSTIQLRRYTIAPGKMGEHVAWFPTMKAAREEYGYTVLFALADYEHDIFTWAVSMPGDVEAFTKMDAAWADSSERGKAFASNPQAVTDLNLSIVADALAG